MKRPLGSIPRALRVPFLPVCLAMLILGCGGAGGGSRAAGPIPESSLIHAQELAQMLAGPDSTRPLAWHVGFEVLYRGGHIPGSRYIGPGSKPEGIQALREALASVPTSQALVLYCGCCPWEECPNMKPTYALAREQGFSPRILYVAKNFQTDWVDRGLATASGNE